MPAQGRLGDKAATGQPDAHGCPMCPHPAIGPAIIGSADVIVNGRPALRFQDSGMHAACCGGCMWTAIQGSATVFINRRPAFRVNDAVQHCGGTGKLIEGSANVFVGDAASAGGGAGGAGAATAAAAASPRVMTRPAFAMTPPPPPLPPPLPPRAPTAPAAPPGRSLTPPALVPQIAALACPADAAPGQVIQLRVARWSPFGTLEPRPTVTWTIDDRPCPDSGDSITVSLPRERAGKTVRVRATAGGKSKDATIVVPALRVEGPTRVEIRKEITVTARVEPETAGTFTWRDASGVHLGDGPTLTFHGRTKSVSEGDQPVTCHFTSAATRNLYRATHPITVDDKPTLMLPIQLSTRTLTETTVWLAKNPIEVRVDDAVTPVHTVVEGPGRVTASFRVAPGEHTVVVTSGPREHSAGQQKIRVVHLSARVKVTEDRPATAVPSQKAGGGKPEPTSKPTTLGRAYSPKVALRESKPRKKKP
jgi:hypothetical protein